MSKFDRKAQLHREDPHRPTVVFDGYTWLARSYATTNEFQVDAFNTLPEAYAKAVEYANANAPLEPTA